MTRSIQWGIAILGAMFFLSCLGFFLPIEIAFFLVAGWIFFLIETLSRMQIDWPATWTALGAFALLLVGSHWLLSSLCRADNSDTATSAWPWRRSMALCFVVVISFAAGTAMVGITHQIAWLATSPEPLVHAAGQESYSRNMAVNNAKMIGLSFHNHHDVFKSLPAGFTHDDRGLALHGWQMRLLPYLEEMALYNKIDRNVPWNAERNAPLFCEQINMFINPVVDRVRNTDHQQPAPSDYAANQLVIGPGKAMRFKNITDGTSHTILGAEVVQNVKPWGSTTNWRDPRLGLNRSPEGFGGPWSAGVTIMSLVDSSVRTVSDDIDPKVLSALATPAGGEPIPNTWDD
jgi:hypothetical protein